MCLSKSLFPVFMTTWHRRKEPELVLLLEIMHCVRNLQIMQITD